MEYVHGVNAEITTLKERISYLEKYLTGSVDALYKIRTALGNCDPWGDIEDILRKINI